MGIEDPWYGTSGPREAATIIVGESWGLEEYQRQVPFVGESGKELDRMLTEAGLSRSEIFCTNVAPDQPRDNDMSNFFSTPEEGVEFCGLHPKEIVQKGLANLRFQIQTIKPKLIIAAGNYATWAILPTIPTIKKKEGKLIPTGIMNTPRQGYRGSQYRNVNNLPTLPILHPAAIMRSWQFRPTTVHDLRKARRFLAGELNWDDVERNFVVAPDYFTVKGQLDQWEAMLDMGLIQILSVDIETYKEHMTCIGLAHNIKGALCIPFVDLKDNKLVPYWEEWEHVAIFTHLRRILGHKYCSVVGQNFLYDLQYIWRWLHVIPRVELDTMIAQHLCFPTLPKDLNYLSSMYCEYHRFWKGEGKEWTKKTSLEELWRYNCRDVVATLEAAQTLRAVLHQLGLEEQLMFQMQQFWLAFALMQRGILVDQKLKGEMKIKLMEAIYEIETWLEALVPQDLTPPKKKAARWYNSDKQTSDFLYETLGLKVQRHKSTGALSCNKEALKALGDTYPFVRPITEALALLRTTSTFVTNFLSASLDRDGRMRCSYNVGGAYTFRLSSSENAFGRGTNLQNIPKNQED
jgi:uracil-DNA glycosylase family 4